MILCCALVYKVQIQSPERSNKSELDYKNRIQINARYRGHKGGLSVFHIRILQQTETKYECDRRGRIKYLTYFIYHYSIHVVYYEHYFIHITANVYKFATGCSWTASNHTRVKNLKGKMFWCERWKTTMSPSSFSPFSNRFYITYTQNFSFIPISLFVVHNTIHIPI